MVILDPDVGYIGYKGLFGVCRDEPLYPVWRFVEAMFGICRDVIPFCLLDQQPMFSHEIEQRITSHLDAMCQKSVPDVKINLSCPGAGLSFAHGLDELLDNYRLVVTAFVGRYFFVERLF
jgi:hypothetical protein